jgi:hypothetical protein
MSLTVLYESESDNKSMMYKGNFGKGKAISRLAGADMSLLRKLLMITRSGVG